MSMRSASSVTSDTPASLFTKLNPSIQNIRTSVITTCFSCLQYCWGLTTFIKNSKSAEEDDISAELITQALFICRLLTHSTLWLKNKYFYIVFSRDLLWANVFTTSSLSCRGIEHVFFSREILGTPVNLSSIIVDRR